MKISLSFLSPVTPQSTLRQSIPAAYLTVHVEGDFDVDIYVDLNGQWVSGDRGSRIEWELIRPDLDGYKELKTWKVKRQTEQLFTERSDRAEWGTLLFTGPSVCRSMENLCCVTDKCARMSITNAELLRNCDNASLEQESCRTESMMISEGSWTESQFLLSPRTSNCRTTLLENQGTRRAALCSQSLMSRIPSCSMLQRVA